MGFLKSTFAYLLIIVCSGMLTNIYAQDNNKLVKANALFKAKRYADAIPIYEELLKQDFNKTILIKLGRSHRIVNNLEQALEKYELIMQQPEVKSEHHLEYVELLIMNSNYKKAKRSLADVASTNGTIEEILKLTSMINNNYDIDSMYHGVVLKPFVHNKPLSDENSPFFLKGRLIYTSDQSGDLKLKGKSGWTGRGFYKIWETQKVGDHFETPKLFSKSVNATNKNTANAYFNIKHGEVLFTKNDNTKDKKDFYNMQLYSSKMKKGKFYKPTKLSVNSTQYNFMHPCVSRDGKTLLYVSDRPGEGGTDIFIARRTKDGWSRGKNIGNLINTKDNEGFPFLDAEDNLYFCSKGHSGLGGYDIYLAKKNEDGGWDPPKNLGRPFNSQHDDISIFFRKNGIEGAFTSSRGGSDDIYLFTIGSKK